MASPEPVVSVCCAACGVRFETTALTERRWRAAGRPPVCSWCRAHPEPPVATEELRRWWLDRYDLAELVEMGRGLVAWSGLLST